MCSGNELVFSTYLCYHNWQANLKLTAHCVKQKIMNERTVYFYPQLRVNENYAQYLQIIDYKT